MKANQIEQFLVVADNKRHSKRREVFVKFGYTSDRGGAQSWGFNTLPSDGYTYSEKDLGNVELVTVYDPKEQWVITKGDTSDFILEQVMELLDGNNMPITASYVRGHLSAASKSGTNNRCPFCGGAYGEESNLRLLEFCANHHGKTYDPATQIVVEKSQITSAEPLYVNSDKTKKRYEIKALVDYDIEDLVEAKTKPMIKPEQQFFSATTKDGKSVLVYRSNDCGILVEMDFSGKYLKTTSRYHDAFTDLQPLTLATANDTVIRDLSAKDLAWWLRNMQPIIPSYDSNKIARWYEIQNKFHEYGAQLSETPASGEEPINKCPTCLTCHKCGCEPHLGDCREATPTLPTPFDFSALNRILKAVEDGRVFIVPDYHLNGDGVASYQISIEKEAT